MLAVAAAPERSVAEILDDLFLGEAPEGWEDKVRRAVDVREGEYPGRTPAARRRWHLGRALRDLRGRVPVAEVASVVEGALGIRSESEPEGVR